MPSGILYLVATPIGNLSDISARAKSTLQSADFVASEDTRVTRRLLTHLEIKKPLISYRAHNEREIGEKILARLIAGESCALTTDAGTPGISDPGETLVRLCAQNNIPVIAVPGPCAAITGLILSGLPAGRFVFEGFLPAVKSKRLAHLETLKDEKRTIVFYEAPHRLERTLLDMAAVLGESRRVSISRELTKVFEETLRTTLQDAVKHFAKTAPRGEFVITVEGAPEPSVSESDKLNDAQKLAQDFIAGGMTLRDAVKKAAHQAGCSQNKLYNAVVKTGKSMPG